MERATPWHAEATVNGTAPSGEAHRRKERSGENKRVGEKKELKGMAERNPYRGLRNAKMGAKGGERE